MKKNIYILTLVTLYVLTLSSCKKKCESDNLGTFSFTATDLEIVPYKGHDSLVFSDSLGNSMIFTGKGRGSSEQYYDQYPNINNDPNFCVGNYFNTEINFVEFVGKNYNFGITVELSMDSGSPFGENIKKFFTITVGYEDTQIWYFGCSFILNNSQINNYSGGGGNIVSLNDSLALGSEKFYSVYVLEQLSNPGSGFSNLQYVFYTITQGVVGFRTNNGHTWYLSNEILKSLKSEIKSQKMLPKLNKYKNIKY